MLTIKVFHLIFIVALLQQFGLIQTNWWNLALISWENSDSYRFGQARAYRGHQVRSIHNFQKPQSKICRMTNGLTKSQVSLCQVYFDHMSTVAIGARICVTECQKRFQYRTWNCSGDDDSLFGSIVNNPNKESGFAHAVASAGVLQSLARSCREGKIRTCGCSISHRPTNLHRQWMWGGCAETEKSYPRKSPQLARSLMNLHNNYVGRLAVTQQSSVACKCHGVSGSCSMRTCWKQVVPFSEVGKFIQRQYDRAIRVKFNRKGTKLKRAKKRMPKPTVLDLIYVEETHDMCNSKTNNSRRGRHCKPQVSAGEESCQRICCGQKHRQIVKRVDYQCNCRFHWCCDVHCDTCHTHEIYHICL